MQFASSGTWEMQDDANRKMPENEGIKKKAPRYAGKTGKTHTHTYTQHNKHKTQNDTTYTSKERIHPIITHTYPSLVGIGPTESYGSLQKL
jgi:hypothetical protein